MTNIAVDIDGVLTDHVTYLLSYLRKDLLKDIEMSKDDIDSWDSVIGGYSFKTIFERCLNDLSFIRDMPVIDGAVESVNQLAGKFHIIIVTARPAFSAMETYRWLKRNGFEFHTLFVGETIDRTELNIDVLIDDNPYSVTAFAKRGRLSIVYSQPWNLKLPPEADMYVRSGNIVRLNTWDEISSYLIKRLEM